MSTIFTMGDALIDFIPQEKGVGLDRVLSFEKAAGGSNANVAAAVGRLGGRSAFIGKVGDDPFGTYLIATLQEAGVDTTRMLRTGEANTSLAFVSLKEDGNRDFMFYRKPGADMLLDASEIQEAWFSPGDILHFASVDLIDAPVRGAHRRAIAAALERNLTVSFDPNVRLPLWDGPESCRRTILEFIPRAHILKISDEELHFITGIEEEEAALSSLFTGNIFMVLYTKGPHGSEAITRSFRIARPAHPVSVVDTTGAGDAFLGAVLYQLQVRGKTPQQLSREETGEILAFANVVAGITTSRKGAIPALPDLEEVRNAIMR